MNRLTAIGLASLVAYGLLIASKYTGVVSVAREQPAPEPMALLDATPKSSVRAVNPEPHPQPIALPPPVVRPDPARVSPMAIEFRSSRDLKAFADGLGARRASLSGDERYYLARALEECQFATTVNEDLAAYSAKKKREFLSSLPAGDPLNPRRIAAYDAVDNTQRCLGFQNTKISPRDIEELYRAAALQGDPRAQARVITADMAKPGQSRAGAEGAQTPVSLQPDDMSRLITLLESHDPETMLAVGEFLARQSNQLRLPNGQSPEPAAFLGGFSLVSCDYGLDCGQSHREIVQACAFAGYCNPANFEQLYQDYVASPWAYTQALWYRNQIHRAIQDRNWSLIGLVPKAANRDLLAR